MLQYWLMILFVGYVIDSIRQSFKAPCLCKARYYRTNRLAWRCWPLCRRYDVTM